MKPTVVADEMFPEGAGPFMELDEVNATRARIVNNIVTVKHFYHLFFVGNEWMDNWILDSNLLFFKRFLTEFQLFTRNVDTQLVVH